MAGKFSWPGQEAFLAAAPSETTPLLLELARRQARRRRPADLLAQFERDDFVAPAAIDLRVLHRLEGLALAAADGYEAIQLSPVAPLGCCSAIAPTSQDRTLSCLRGTEVLSDPTNVFALECARRLDAHPLRAQRLCTVARILRAQSLGADPRRTRHFQMFALADAGPGRAEDAFEVDAILGQLGVFQRVLDEAERSLAYRFQRRMLLLATSERGVLAQRVAARLSMAYPALELARGSLESPYYAGIRFNLEVSSESAGWSQIADIGLFDWVARLTSNARMRFVAGGFGLQLMHLLFDPARPP
jgi:hypothetical protein